MHVRNYNNYLQINIYILIIFICIQLNNKFLKHTFEIILTENLYDKYVNNYIKNIRPPVFCKACVRKIQYIRTNFIIYNFLDELIQVNLQNYAKCTKSKLSKKQNQREKIYLVSNIRQHILQEISWPKDGAG